MTKDLRHLIAAYLFAVLVHVVSAILELYRHFPVIAMLTAVIPVCMAHINAALPLGSWRTKKTFYVLSGIWLVYFVVFTSSLVLIAISLRSAIIVHWLGLFLQNIILIMVSLSFLLGTPFFFTATRSRLLRALGVLTLLFSVWGSVTLLNEAMEFWRGFSWFLAVSPLGMALGTLLKC
jgi:hypothetical protein